MVLFKLFLPTAADEQFTQLITKVSIAFGPDIANRPSVGWCRCGGSDYDEAADGRRGCASPRARLANGATAPMRFTQPTIFLLRRGHKYSLHRPAAYRVEIFPLIDFHYIVGSARSAQSFSRAVCKYVAHLQKQNTIDMPPDAESIALNFFGSSLLPKSAACGCGDIARHECTFECTSQFALGKCINHLPR